MSVPVTPKDGDELWTTIAWWCRSIGILGVFILLGLIVYNIYLSHEANHAGACFGSPVHNVAVSDADPEGVRIIGIEPSDLELNHNLCVEVDNVVSAAKQNELLANVTVAANAVKSAAATSNATKGATQAPAQADANVADAVQMKAKTDLVAAKATFDDSQKPRVVTLYLNGKASPLTATARAIPGSQTLTFEIAAPEDANKTDAAYWRALLSEPTIAGKIPIRVGVAEQGAPAPLVNVDRVNLATTTELIRFVAYTPLIMYGATAAMIGIGLLFFGWAYGTTLLRSGQDRGTAYSLALVQMAVWLILTTTGFVYIWVVTGQYQNVFTSGLFVLIGISGATATAARVIDRGQSAPKSKGFFHDIVGAWDGGEVQLQRIQIVTWTVILALIFIWNVLGKLTLTSFDTNLLVLTGIANGVYVSLKPQEAKSPDPSEQTRKTKR